MSKSNLFRHIRFEDAIIWAGAGLSKYAGYPLGNELKEILLSNLTEEDRSLIDVNASLADVSEEFVRLKNGSKNELFRILKSVFEKRPMDVSNHQSLSKIPHLQTYVTTNYDNLLEDVFSLQSNKIVRDLDVSFWDKSKVNIVKIHGDLAYPESIVLTKSDYASFYKPGKFTPLWSVVTEKIATKVVVFIGYGYEDPNIWAIFDHVAEHLREHRREAYFIGRNLKAHRVAFLNRNGIEYIDLSVEDFLSELVLDIKDNIMEDFEKQNVSPETFRRFLTMHNLQPTLKGTDEGFVMDSIKGLNDMPLSGTLNIVTPNYSDLQERLDDFFKNADTGQVDFEEDVLEGVSYTIEGINMQSSEMKIAQLSLIKHPSVVYEFDLVFLLQDFELNNLKANVFRGASGSVLKLKVHGLNLKLKFASQEGQFVKIDLEYEHDSLYKSLKEALESYTFLKYLFSGFEFTIVFKEGKGRFRQSAGYDEQKVRYAQSHIDYFSRLKQIERFYQLRFENFGPPTQGSANLAKMLIKIMHNEPIIATAGELSFVLNDVNESTLEPFEQLNREDHIVKINRAIDKFYELHGQHITFRYQEVSIVHAKVVNLEDLKAGTTRTVRVRSEKDVVEERYFIEKPVEI